MTIIDLKNKWSTLVQTDSLRGYKSAIMSTDCLSDIFLGVNALENHCLILALPRPYNLDFKQIKKEKISITFYPETYLLVVELHDNLYYDIFDDLIISLYQAIKSIKDVDLYTQKFIQTFNKWSSFFEDESLSSLSKDEIQGLFGEMYILESIIEESNIYDIDDILNGWRGPYDGPYDFVFDKKNIEVKTKKLSKQTVNISSEFQLESEINKNLELLVLSVEEDVMNGLSLRELLERIKMTLLRKSGDFSVLLKALHQKNITQKNISIYDNYRFLALQQTIYDCEMSEFPKLTKSNTPQAIENLKYTLNLNHIDTFIISTRRLND